MTVLKCGYTEPFALGPVGFKDAFLTEIQPNGQWQQVAIESRLVLT